MTHLDAFADGLEAAKSGDRMTARRQFEQVAEMAPEFTPGLVWLAWTSDTLSEAADYLEQAERLSPNDPLVANYRSVMDALTDFEMTNVNHLAFSEYQVAANVQGLSAELQSRLHFVASNAADPADHGETPCVLVVDDNPAVLKTLRMTLTAAGYQVKTAANGAAALEVLEEVAPQLMLVDVAMPQMDGYHFCKQVRHHPSFRSTPLIMLSGKDGTFDSLKGAAFGCFHAITKPFRATDLLELVGAQVAH